MKKILSTFLAIAIIFVASPVVLASAKAPAKPKISSIKATSYNKIIIKWSTDKKVNGYKIYRRVDKGKFKLIKTINNKNTKSYTNSGLKSSTKYYYSVRAFTKNKKTIVLGKMSAEKSVKTKAFGKISLSHDLVEIGLNESAYVKVNFKSDYLKSNDILKKVMYKNNQENFKVFVSTIDEKTAIFGITADKDVEEGTTVKIPIWFEGYKHEQKTIKIELVNYGEGYYYNALEVKDFGAFSNTPAYYVQENYYVYDYNVAKQNSADFIQDEELRTVYEDELKADGFAYYETIKLDGDKYTHYYNKDTDTSVFTSMHNFENVKYYIIMVVE